MHEREEKDSKQVSGYLDAKSLSRRQFLKVAGVAGAAVGLSGGLGGMIAGCGGTEETTTTSTSEAAATTTTAGATTTVSTGPEGGRDIILGLVSPSTGPLALFAKADDWWVDYAMNAVPDGDPGRRRQETQARHQAHR